MKAYWDFKPGTYWIYKDSVTGAIDSVYVTNRINYTGEGTLNYNGDEIIYEFLQINTHSSLDEYDYQYWINTQAGGTAEKDFNVVFRNRPKPRSYNSNKCFVFPYVVGLATYQSFGAADDTCIIRNIFSSNYGFNSVIQIDNALNNFEDLHYSKSYYAKGIGRIKYEVPDSNKFRNLISYYINP